MKFITNLLAGVLLTGVLALAPANSFARGGGGGGGHFGGGGGGNMGAFHGGFGSGGHGVGAWRHDGGWSHHWYPGFYGYFGPFDYGSDDYTGTYYDDNALP